MKLTQEFLDDGTRAFVAGYAGGVYFIVRALDRDTFLANAVAVNLMKNVDGQIVPIDDVSIVEPGHIQLVKPTIDRTTGRVTDPGVLDTRWHVNIWLGPTVKARGEWKALAETWRSYGTLSNPNKDEVAHNYNGIELIDPFSIDTPALELG